MQYWLFLNEVAIVFLTKAFINYSEQNQDRHVSLCTCLSSHSASCLPTLECPTSSAFTVTPLPAPARSAHAHHQLVFAMCLTASIWFNFSLTISLLDPTPPPSNTPSLFSIYHTTEQILNSPDPSVSLSLSLFFFFWMWTIFKVFN